MKRISTAPISTKKRILTKATITITTSTTTQILTKVKENHLPPINSHLKMNLIQEILLRKIIIIIIITITDTKISLLKRINQLQRVIVRAAEIHQSARAETDSRNSKEKQPSTKIPITILTSREANLPITEKISLQLPNTKVQNPSTITTNHSKSNKRSSSMKHQARNLAEATARLEKEVKIILAQTLPQENSLLTQMEQTDK